MTKKYRTFVNCQLGRTFKDVGDTISDEQFTTNRHWYGCEIPQGVMLLTAAIDTQDDRIEIDVCGWGIGFERWGIQYLIIAGHPNARDVTDQVDALLNRVWIREDGAQLIIARLVWDSGGHYTDDVYDYCRKRQARGVYAIHGGTDYRAPLVGAESKALRKGIQTSFFTLGVNVGKDRVFDSLQTKEVGPGFCHWPLDPNMADKITPRGYNDTYFAQLTSEHRVQHLTRGRRHTVWQPKRKGLRNEAWDLMVYNLAAVLILGGATYLEAVAAQQPAAGQTHAPALPVSAGRRVYSSGIR